MAKKLQLALLVLLVAFSVIAATGQRVMAGNPIRCGAACYSTSAFTPPPG